MKIAIQEREGSFSKMWLEYCAKKNIDFKFVNVYQSDIIQQLKGCTHFLWHWSHGDATAQLFARQLIKSVESMGIKVFPSSEDCWHFDDKVGQKYLLEALNAPLVPSYIFYSKHEALEWINNTSFPKVFKLRGGAGSSNVKLVKNKKKAKQLINKAFNKGFNPVNNKYDLNKKTKAFFQGKLSPLSLIKSIGNIFLKSQHEKIKGNEVGYSYFQDFLPNNNFDTRIVVIGKKAIGIKRMTRENDFRASGSGKIEYDKNQIDINCIKIAFEVNQKLKANCTAFDFIYDINKNPLIIEISYAFSARAYDNCQGYWDNSLTWHNEKVNIENFIFENILN